jgi:hypothetical protein
LPAPARDDVAASHAALVAHIAGARVSRLRLYPAPEDFTARAVAADAILAAVKEHLTTLVRDTAPHSSEIDGEELARTIDAHLSDLSGDIAGTFDRAAVALTDERYEGCPRGPMHRIRI